MWNDLLSALALMIVLEGIMPFVNPKGLRETLLVMANLDDNTLRLIGFLSMLTGTGMLYLIK